MKTIDLFKVAGAVLFVLAVYFTLKVQQEKMLGDVYKFVAEEEW